MDKTLMASRFKAQCLALLDKIAETSEALVVTKRGCPVARVDPVQAPASLRSSVTFRASDEELTAPLPERWNTT
jgi:antitoxin (DNA-binding transcriptional repressor) of toxin-antitoxin stability system